MSFGLLVVLTAVVASPPDAVGRSHCLFDWTGIDYAFVPSNAAIDIGLLTDQPTDAGPPETPTLEPFGTMGSKRWSIQGGPAVDFDGENKFGLFGAGYLSHLICPHLGHMPAQIVALFDEHPMLVGGQLAGIPIHRPSQARELGVQVVIPVTMVHQATLIERWNRVTGGDPPVVPLWARELSATLTAPPCHTPAL